MATSCSVGHGCGSDLVLLWLWRRLAAPIGALARDLLYATGAALKEKRKTEREGRKEERKGKKGRNTGLYVTGPGADFPGVQKRARWLGRGGFSEPAPICLGNVMDHI